MVTIQQLKPGLTYRVQYRLGGQRSDRIMVARFMDSEAGRFDHTMWWDLRPLGGTTQLRGSDIISMDRTAAPVSLPATSKAVGR